MGWRVSSARFEDGVELSGGQWQQLALGRGMMRTPAAPLLLLLDEPTAALDPPLPEEAAVAWVAAGAGVGSIGAGLVQAFYGEPTSFARILTIIGQPSSRCGCWQWHLAGPGWTR